MKKIVGLDSLRFFAIILIVIYHIWRQFLPGGFIAVEIFFVLSGFLIAYKLLETFSKSEFSISKFIWSRLKKFYPVILATIILTLTLGFFVNSDLMTRVREHTISALTFSTNIVEIVNGGSYETQIIPNVFEHFWFLALLMQLYVILYILLMLTRRTTRNTAPMFIILSLASYALMALFGGRYELYTRAYFGIDSHAGAFFLGAALAGLMRTKNYIAAFKHKIWSFVGILAAFTGVVFLSVITKYESSATFYYVLPATALLTVLIIYLILKAQPRKDKKLNFVVRMFEYFGSASFYIYMFHWPLYVLLPEIVPLDIAIVDVIVILLSILLAILMEKVIMPGIKKMLTGKAWQKVLITMILAGLLVLPVWTLIKSPDVSSIEMQLADESVAASEREIVFSTDHIDFGSTEALADKLNEKIVPYLSGANKYAATPVYYNYTSGYAAANISSARVLIIGDSVTLGAWSALENAVLGIYVDATGSRGMDSAAGLLSQYKASSGRLPNIIVISLVTNWRNITDAMLQNIMNVGGLDKQYVFVTGYCGNTACGDGTYSRNTQNSVLRNFAAARGNVHIADWYSMVVHNPGYYMNADHTHLNPNGRLAYAGLIKGVVDSL